MPIIIPARGINGSVWPFTAFRVLEDAGCFSQNPVNGPLMRAPSTGAGDFMKRGLKTSEVSSVLRNFLNINEPVKGSVDEVVSSHSLKATFLAWSARYGLSPQTRSLLGRHTTCLNETFAIYSRDLACAPVAELQKLIDCVHDGSFVPDGERSKFFRAVDVHSHARDVDVVKQEQPDHDSVITLHDSPQGTDTAEQARAGDVASWGGSVDENASQTQADVADAPDMSSPVPVDDTDSSSSGSDAASSEESDVVEPPSRVKRFRARIPVHEKWYVHAKSHLVHRYEGDAHNDAKFLVCGKLLTGSYSVCTEATAWNTLCKSCNRR